MMVSHSENNYIMQELSLKGLVLHTHTHTHTHHTHTHTHTYILQFEVKTIQKGFSQMFPAALLVKVVVMGWGQQKQPEMYFIRITNSEQSWAGTNRKSARSGSTGGKYQQCQQKKARKNPSMIPLIGSVKTYQNSPTYF